MKEGQKKEGRDPGRGTAPAVVESIAGGFAGFMSTMFGHPLDLIRTHQQTYINQKVAVQENSKSLSAWDAVRRIHRGGGERTVLAFYRGFTPNVVASAVSWSAFFTLKTRCEYYISHAKASMDPSCPRDAQGYVKLSPANYFLSSVIAGGAIQIATNPFWVVKTRMMMSTPDQSGYATTFAAIRSLHAEGWRSFYKGLAISGVGVLQGGVQFVFYDSLKAWAKEKTFGSTKDTEKQSPAATWLFSTVSKAIPTTLSYPYHTIRSRLQMVNASERFGVGIKGVSKVLYAEGGFRAFYRGLPSTLARNMPSTWAVFLAYEGARPYLMEWFGDADKNKSGDELREP